VKDGQRIERMGRRDVDEGIVYIVIKLCSRESGWWQEECFTCEKTG
jgi:hypothetical protein